MEELILSGFVTVLAAGYVAAGRLSRAARRRRDARTLRLHLLREVEAGRRSLDDEIVADVLVWCDEVAQTGRDLPLTVR
jgi:CRISPR/Cas system Type II protein with McrA/HNH and RuvC-like nuclease domain